MQKVIRTGNSLALTIPNKFVKMMGIKSGDRVKVEKRPDKGTITFSFDKVFQLPISQEIFRHV